MKAGRVAIVGILFIAMLVVPGANADKPQGQGRPGKPPSLSQECIVFTGDLDGKQPVTGCCLNRGPFPAYTMTLSGEILEGIPEGVYYGQLFVNQYGPGRIHDYMVEFWTDALHFVVIGGDVVVDTKNRLEMDFKPENSECTDLKTHGQCLGAPTFTLVRTSDLRVCGQ